MSIIIGREAKVTLNRDLKLSIVSEYASLINPIPGPSLTLVFNSTGTNFQNWFVQGSSTFNMTVYWGDGSINNYTSANNYQPSHVYRTAGNYTAFVTFSDPTAITYLDISTGYGNNRLQSIAGLDILSSSLSSLMLGGNQLYTFTSASGLTSQSILSTLDLSYNGLSSFDTTLPDSLTDLYLNNNSLGNFNPPTALPIGLNNLYLNNNLLNYFNPAYPLPYYLTTLNLSNNQLPNFIPTYPLPSGLETLDLSYNYITTFQPTGSFPNGNSYLYLNNNNMSSTNISNALIYLSGSVTNWVAPNNMVLFNQAVGACVTNPSTAYSAAQYLTSVGWTVDIDVC
jgi:Leucine-rich repeat (LRR) protein